jgi:hypothetical protein
MESLPDPFPTTKLSVPNLTELVTRLRDPDIRRCITIVHAKREGEGDWVLANGAARLKRTGNVKVFGPEAGTPADVVEHAIRIDAKVVFTGELKRGEDGVAFRKAASFGIRPVGIITVIRLIEAQMLLESLGPWREFNVALLSTDLADQKKTAPE